MSQHVAYRLVIYRAQIVVLSAPKRGTSNCKKGSQTPVVLENVLNMV